VDTLGENASWKGRIFASWSWVGRFFAALAVALAVTLAFGVGVGVGVGTEAEAEAETAAGAGGGGGGGIAIFVRLLSSRLCSLLVGFLLRIFFIGDNFLEGLVRLLLLFLLAVVEGLPIHANPIIALGVRFLR